MRAAALAIAVAALPPAGLAQIGNPGFFAPDTRFDAPGQPAPNQPNANDVLFAQLVAEGGRAEVAFAELAAEKADADAVGDFASRMIDDHSAANDRLAGLAEDSGIPLPEGLNPDHEAMLAELEGLEGRDFDLAYMRGQVVDHQKATQLLIWEINAGQEGELQRFASDTLPTILEHLRLAQEIVADLSADVVAEAGDATAGEPEMGNDAPAEAEPMPEDGPAPAEAPVEAEPEGAPAEDGVPAEGE